MHRQARRLVQAIAEPPGLPRYVCAGGAEADRALAQASKERVVVAQESGERAQGRPAGDVDEREKLLPSASLTPTLNGVDYVTSKNIVSLEPSWKNNIRMDEERDLLEREKLPAWRGSGPT